MVLLDFHDVAATYLTSLTCLETCILLFVFMVYVGFHDVAIDLLDFPDIPSFLNHLTYLKDTRLTRHETQRRKKSERSPAWRTSPEEEASPRAPLEVSASSLGFLDEVRSALLVPRARTGVEASKGSPPGAWRRGRRSRRRGSRVRCTSARPPGRVIDRGRGPRADHPRRGARRRRREMARRTVAVDARFT